MRALVFSRLSIQKHAHAQLDWTVRDQPGPNTLRGEGFHERIGEGEGEDVHSLFLQNREAIRYVAASERLVHEEPLGI